MMSSRYLSIYSGKFMQWPPAPSPSIKPCMHERMQSFERISKLSLFSSYSRSEIYGRLRVIAKRHHTPIYIIVGYAVSVVPFLDGTLSIQKVSI